jgi:hypothetical protein
VTFRDTKQLAEIIGENLDNITDGHFMTACMKRTAKLPSDPVLKKVRNSGVVVPYIVLTTATLFPAAKALINDNYEREDDRTVLLHTFQLNKRKLQITINSLQYSVQFKMTTLIYTASQFDGSNIFYKKRLYYEPYELKTYPSITIRVSNRQFILLQRDWIVNESDEVKRMRKFLEKTRESLAYNGTGKILYSYVCDSNAVSVLAREQPQTLQALIDLKVMTQIKAYGIKFVKAIRTYMSESNNNINPLTEQEVTDMQQLADTPSMGSSKPIYRNYGEIVVTQDVQAVQQLMQLLKCQIFDDLVIILYQTAVIANITLKDFCFIVAELCQVSKQQYPLWLPAASLDHMFSTPKEILKLKTWYDKYL